MESLAHLRAPVGQQDGAVRVDVHEGACLVQELHREGDPELRGKEVNAAFPVPVPSEGMPNFNTKRK